MAPRQSESTAGKRVNAITNAMITRFKTFCTQGPCLHAVPNMVTLQLVTFMSKDSMGMLEKKLNPEKTIAHTTMETRNAMASASIRYSNS